LKRSAAWIWILAAGLLLAWEDFKGRNAGRLSGGPLGFAVAILGLALVSWLASPFKSAGEARLDTFFQGFLLAAAGLAMPRRWIGAQLQGLLWAAVAVAVYALLQRRGWEFMPDYKLPGASGRAVGTFGNATLLAAFLCLVWPLALPLRQGAKWAVLMLLFAALVATRSRAGLLAVLVQAAVLARQAWRQGWRPKMDVIGGLAVAGLMLALYFPQADWSRPTLRWLLWQDSLNLWWQRPWLGWGPGSFPLAFQPLHVALGASLGGGQYVDHPHNWVLLALCETGLLGLASLSLFFGIPLRRVLSRGLGLATQDYALALGLLGLLAQAFFDRSLEQAGLWSLACLFTGFLAGAVPWEGKQYPRPSAALLFGIAALAALLNFWRPIQSWRLAVHALPAALEQAGEAADWKRRVEAEPGNPAAWESLGLALAAQNKFDDAERAFEQAWRLRPSVSAVLNLGNCAMMTRQFEKAEVLFRQAIAIEPARADAHFSLGYALFQQKKLQEAVAELDLALKLDPGNAGAAKLKEEILQ
jgi:O-antigen ligase